MSLELFFDIQHNRLLSLVFWTLATPCRLLKYTFTARDMKSLNKTFSSKLWILPICCMTYGCFQYCRLNAMIMKMLRLPEFYIGTVEGICCTSGTWPDHDYVQEKRDIVLPLARVIVIPKHFLRHVETCAILSPPNKLNQNPHLQEKQVWALRKPVY